jgi:hypothetical protein
MKARGMEVYFHAFLLSEIDVSGQHIAPAALIRGKRPRYPWREDVINHGDILFLCLSLNIIKIIK